MPAAAVGKERRLPLALATHKAGPVVLQDRRAGTLQAQRRLAHGKAACLDRGEGFGIHLPYDHRRPVAVVLDHGSHRQRAHGVAEMSREGAGDQRVGEADARGRAELAEDGAVQFGAQEIPDPVGNVRQRGRFGTTALQWRRGHPYLLLERRRPRCVRPTDSADQCTNSLKIVTV